MSYPSSASDIACESTNTSQESLTDDGIIEKLRRIKIHEDLLIQNIKKNICESDNGFIKYDLEYKKYLAKLKTSFTDIKQLFDDLKCVTNTQDILHKSDIDDIKKDVLELDEKIKSFKTFLEKELNNLKSAEKYLAEQENENRGRMERKFTKIQSKTYYSDIIPSPVKNIINSPFKYPDVQKFQDFLSQSQKHGGWNEYNHNIFIRLWQKHFQYEEDFINFDSLDQNKITLFINDVSENIAGTRNGDIISHMEWYNKYLSLKKRQQKAIEEWRAKNKPNKVVSQASSLRQGNESTSSNRSQAPRKCNKKDVRKYGEHTFTCESSRSQNDNEHVDVYFHCETAEQDSFNEYINKLSIEMDKARSSKSCMDNTVPQYARSTKQWNNRCNSAADDIQHRFHHPDAIIKLGIPSWRSKLMNYNDFNN